MIKAILLFLCCINLATLYSQVHEDRTWCKINCDPTIHTENSDLVYGDAVNDSIAQAFDIGDTLKFPVRIVFVEEVRYTPGKELKQELNKVISNLNYSFRNARFTFSLDQIEVIESEVKIEDLSENRFELYDRFSEEHDLDDMITVFILDHKNEYCTISNSRISCSRTGGFSYILSGRTNNLVLSKFDLLDSKVVAHEFGHFFGLYHTFEESLFGKDTFSPGECSVKGDLICDTAPDPGSIFEVYINYTSCEMIGLTDSNGNEYSPLIQNYMSYYKPCYLTEYSFTRQQEMYMTVASQLDMRKKLSR